MLGFCTRLKRVRFLNAPIFKVSHNEGCEKTNFGFQSFAQSRLRENVTLVFKVSHNRGCEKRRGATLALRNAGVQL